MEKILTIIVPCYNSAEYLERCVDSLLGGGKRVEIILVDDGSTDATGAMLDGYARDYQNIRVIHQENRGHGGAINHALSVARGQYVKIVDSDDWLDPNAYQAVLNFLTGHEPVDLLVCNYLYDKPALQQQKRVKFNLPVGETFGWDQVKLRPGQYLMLHAIIYRREVLVESGIKLPEKVSYDDNLFVFEPMKYVDTICYLPVDLYHYYTGRDDQSVNEQVMLRKINQQLLINQKMIIFYAAQIGESDPCQKYLKYYLEIITTISSVILLMAGDRQSLKLKRELWNFLKVYDYATYKSFRKRPLGLGVNLPGRGGRRVVTRLYQVAKKIYAFN